MYREPAKPRAVKLTSEAGAASWWRRGNGRLEAYLGSRVIVGARTYTSLDGLRRVRFEASDTRARFEELDLASGITQCSHRAKTSAGPRADQVHVASRSWHALVLGRSTSQVCFLGYPPALGGRPRATSARMVRVLAYDDGARLDRIAGSGAIVGDSWHDDVEGALRQLEHEYGSHVGRLRAGLGRVPLPTRRVWT